MWNRPDLIDLMHAQVCEPAMKAKQRVVAGTEVLRQWLAGDGAIPKELAARGIRAGICEFAMHGKKLATSSFSAHAGRRPLAVAWRRKTISRVCRYFKPPFPRSARAAGSREAVNRVVFGDNLPLSMPFTP